MSHRTPKLGLFASQIGRLILCSEASVSLRCEDVFILRQDTWMKTCSSPNKRKRRRKKGKRGKSRWADQSKYLKYRYNAGIDIGLIVV